MKPLELGEPVLGLSGVGMVTASRVPGFHVGDLVHAPLNWPWVELFNARTNDPANLTLEKVGSLCNFYDKLKESVKKTTTILLIYIYITHEIHCSTCTHVVKTVKISFICFSTQHYLCSDGDTY